MADINVDINLPSAIDVDVTSPTQALATNISIPGPQGPAGIQGPSGATGPSGAMGSTGATGPSGIVNTGQFDLRYYSINNPSGFISGNLDLYATKINLASTGSNLNTSILSLSGLFTGYTGSLDNNYATDAQLQNTGSNLYTLLTNFSGNLDANYATDTQLFNTGSNLYTLITNFSGNLDADFASQAEINALSGYVNSQDTSISNNLRSTGSTLDNRINSLSGWSASAINLTSTGATLTTNLFNTGSNLNTKIDNLSGYVNSQDTNISNNLTLTGSTLISNINSLNSAFTGFTGNLDANYATDLQLFNTGSTLDNKINSLSGVSVLTYGNQTINGLKDFTTRPTVNTTPVLLSGENANGLTVLVKNDDSVTLNKGQPVYIYGANGNNILVRKAVNTGEATSSKTLGLLNQSLAPNAQGLVITEGALEGIDTNAGNAGDPVWLGPTGDLIFGLANKPYAPNHLVYLGVIERQQINNGKIYVKVQNGFELQELHNVNIDHKNALNNNDILRYNSASGLWFNETLNTGTFQTQINSLSGSSVLLYGDQSVGGVKTFRDNVYINNLFVTGTQTVVSTNNFSVQSPYLLLNLTGGAVDGGIFFVTGAGLTGINDTGPIIGFDHSNKFKFGVSTRNSDLSTLPDIASVQNITTYSGFVDGKYSTIINLVSTGSTLSTNLASTGSTLQTNINNLSNTYATITNLGLTGSTLVTNLANTGSTLNTKINNLSGYINSSSSNIVFTTGNQTISGVKSFAQDTTFGDSAQGDFLVISGNNFTVYGSGNFTSGLFVNGNAVLTGVNLSSYATITNLASTGSTLDSKIGSLSGTLTSTYATITNLASTGSTLNTNINSLSGTLTSNYATITNLASTGSTLVNSIGSLSGTLTSNYSTITNLASTGSTLDTKINNLSGVSVLTFGNQTISGTKTFANNINVSGTGTFFDTSIFVDEMTVSGMNLTVANGTGIFSFLNISGNYDIYSQIENSKKLAIAYAIAL